MHVIFCQAGIMWRAYFYNNFAGAGNGDVIDE